MTKEIRKELRDLKQQQREIHRGFQYASNVTLREIARLKKSLKREERLADKKIDHINRRRSILEGRLS